MKQETHDLFQDICRKNKWRCTIQRRAVFELILGGLAHLDAETIWRAVSKRVHGISLDSVYRILDGFTAAGLLRRVEGFRPLRYDTNTDPHDHFVCSKCGRIFDFTFLEAGRLPTACESLGVMTSAELQVRGLCKGCLRPNDPDNGETPAQR